VQGLEATDDIITHQPLIEYIGNVMLRDQYNNGETSFERYVVSLKVWFIRVIFVKCLEWFVRFKL